MGLPRYHEQTVLLLIYRTIHNYEDIWHRRGHFGPFEVTQLINSFMGAFAHPWDRLLDTEALSKMKLHDKRFLECQFPVLPEIDDGIEGKTVESVDDYLRFLRNGIAHGNFELLSRKELQVYTDNRQLPGIKESEIAGLRIWNQPTTSEISQPNWSTALSVYDLKACLYAMQRLCEKRHLWIPSVREEQERRDRSRLSA